MPPLFVSPNNNLSVLIQFAHSLNIEVCGKKLRDLQELTYS